VTDVAHGRTSLMSGLYVVDIITHLGYPVYFLTILGVWKLLGGMTLFALGLPRLKERAYAGIIFELTGAAASFVAHGDNARELIAPLVLAGIAVASWALCPPSRTLGVLFPSRNAAYGSNSFGGAAPDGRQFRQRSDARNPTGVMPPAGCRPDEPKFVLGTFDVARCPGTLLHLSDYRDAPRFMVPEISMSTLTKASSSAAVWVLLATLASLAVPVVDPQQAPIASSMPREGFITTDDSVRIYYHIVGTGRPVVIVPAGLFLERDFARSGRDRTVVFYDMRGRGRSPPVDDSARISIGHDVADLEAVRMHVGAERFIPFGWSYLGMMVMRLRASVPGARRAHRTDRSRRQCVRHALSGLARRARHRPGNRLRRLRGAPSTSRGRSGGARSESGL
jgi:DoxX-like family